MTPIARHLAFLLTVAPALARARSPARARALAIPLAVSLTLAFSVTALTACSIRHRSDEFACEKPADCSTGRSCINGFCVAEQVDAGGKGDGPSSGVCPAPCTSCTPDTRSCVIDCARDPEACGRAITCPAGWSCNIACSTSDACRSGISCTGATSCEITCSGKQSCENISCGSGRCSVDCSGPDACNVVRCGLSCACDVMCAATALCAGVACRSPLCTRPGPGCTSLLNGCNTCR